VLALTINGPALMVSGLELYAFDDDSHTSGKRVKASASDVTTKEDA
jgi:hypothetical protein